MLKWPFGALFLKFELAGSQKCTTQKLISVSALLKVETKFIRPYKKRHAVLINDYTYMLIQRVQRRSFTFIGYFCYFSPHLISLSGLSHASKYHDWIPFMCKGRDTCEGRALATQCPAVTTYHSFTENVPKIWRKFKKYVYKFSVSFLLDQIGLRV